MNNGNRDVFIYLLIDNGLLQGTSASCTEADSKSRPGWLVPVYTEPALSVSPLLVDIEAAYEAGDLDQVMCWINALKPGLHVSIIETRLSISEMARHLRQFIFILDPQGSQFTLRYADCAVLASLPLLLTGPQWSTISGPIIRWDIHDRSGALIHLPSVEGDASGSTPLSLDEDQLAAIDDASEPDHYIAKVKMMRNGVALPGTAAEHHAWALSARETWRVSGNSNLLFLLFLTEAALVSRGDVVHRREVQGFLAMDEVSAFRIRLRELVREGMERRNRTSRSEITNEKSTMDVFFI